VRKKSKIVRSGGFTAPAQDHYKGGKGTKPRTEEGCKKVSEEKFNGGKEVSLKSSILTTARQKKRGNNGGILCLQLFIIDQPCGKEEEESTIQT